MVKMRETMDKSATDYKDIPVAIDTKLDVYINNNYYTTIYLTPENIQDAIIGMLITDRIVNKLSDIKNINISGSKIYVDAAIDREIKSVIYDECLSIKEINKFVKDNGYRVKWSEIIEIYRDFNKSTDNIRRGLAMHTSAIYLETGDKIMSLDVSRHISILKLLGKVIREGIKVDKSILITSGRVSSDMVYRAALMNIPIILTMHGPLSSGLTASLLSGITLIVNIKRGKGKGLRPLTHEYRIEDYI